MTPGRWHYKNQGCKWKCIHQSIFPSRTKSDHHSLLVANNWKNSFWAAIYTEYISMMVKQLLCCVGRLFHCFQHSQRSMEILKNPFFFLTVWGSEDGDQSSPTLQELMPVAGKRFRRIRVKENWKNWKRKREQIRETVTWEWRQKRF